MSPELHINTAAQKYITEVRDVFCCALFMCAHLSKQVCARPTGGPSGGTSWTPTGAVN